MSRKRVRAEAVDAQAVKVGDVVELDSGVPRLAVLPDGTVVTCGRAYQVQHAGHHVIGGVEYHATDPRKAEATEAEDQDPEV